MIEDKVLIKINSAAERRRRENQRIIDELNRRAGKSSGFSVSISLNAIYNFLKKLWRKR